jgi:hypothetical protein
MRCWCEYGELLNKLNDHYDINGWPLVEGCVTNNHKLWEIDDISRECRFALSRVELNSGLMDYDFLDDPIASNLFFNLCAYVPIGEYDFPIDSSISAMKKDVICRTMKILYQIWCERKTDPEYKYDNVQEWNCLLDAYQLYKEEVGPQISFYKWKDDGLSLEYEGPQFGKYLEDAQRYINDVHFEKKEHPNKLEKKI